MFFFAVCLFSPIFPSIDRSIDSRNWMDSLEQSAKPKNEAKQNKQVLSLPKKKRKMFFSKINQSFAITHTHTHTHTLI